MGAEDTVCDAILGTAQRHHHCEPSIGNTPDGSLPTFVGGDKTSSIRGPLEECDGRVVLARIFLGGVFLAIRPQRNATSKQQGQGQEGKILKGCTLLQTKSYKNV